MSIYWPIDIEVRFNNPVGLTQFLQALQERHIQYFFTGDSVILDQMVLLGLQRDLIPPLREFEHQEHTVRREGEWIKTTEVKRHARFVSSGG